MPHCTKCGAMVADNAGFCPNCGAAQVGTGGAASSSAMTQTGMKENVAGLLCYVLGWVTGLIFFFIDKRSIVQFHAKQSIVLFGGLHLIGIVLGSESRRKPRIKHNRVQQYFRNANQRLLCPCLLALARENSNVVVTVSGVTTTGPAFTVN